jgi:undecaprenyl-diphosphatase
MGFGREAAARYAFLLAMPAVFGSGFYELYKVISHGELAGIAGLSGWLILLLATLVSFIVGYVSIVVFLKIVSTRSYFPFAVYRVGFGALVLLLLAVGFLH